MLAAVLGRGITPALRQQSPLVARSSFPLALGSERMVDFSNIEKNDCTSKVCEWDWHSLTQRRWRNPINSVSLLQQYYNKLPVRKKWKKAIRRGTMIWCEKTGQVKIPPIAIAGYDEKKNPYRGKLENLRSPRIWFKD
mmetsp:Transcript_46907/g.73214  ORF Transcript_46907/g.73214 Transcript_46907/m.73214 type:complete len:138 (-) Transcript_46907:42-455(-)